MSALVVTAVGLAVVERGVLVRVGVSEIVGRLEVAIWFRVLGTGLTNQFRHV